MSYLTNATSSLSIVPQISTRQLIHDKIVHWMNQEAGLRIDSIGGVEGGRCAAALPVR